MFQFVVGCLPSWQPVILAPVHALAILACITRLVYRKRTCRLWWDDFWALVALLCECTTVVAYGIRKGAGIRFH